jgi:hypothetical protein
MLAEGEVAGQERRADGRVTIGTEIVRAEQPVDGAGGYLGEEGTAGVGPTIAVGDAATDEDRPGRAKGMSAGVSGPA